MPSLPDMPNNHVQLARTKPTQADLDTAARVLWWLAGHARLFPDEYGVDLGHSLAPVDVFVATANACGVHVDDVITTMEEHEERDKFN